MAEIAWIGRSSVKAPQVIPRSGENLKERLKNFSRHRGFGFCLISQSKLVLTNLKIMP